MSRMERRKKEEASKRLNKKSKLKRWQKVLIAVAIIVLCALIGTYAYIQSKLNKMNRPELTEENQDKFSDEALSCVDIDGYANILLLGIDSRDMDDYKGSRSDCIIIASIEEETGKVFLTSIYRDTYVDIAGQDYYTKINHALADKGPKGAIKTVNEALDLDIKKYVMFNFKSVADVVDEIGGLEIDVEDYEIDELNRVSRQTAHILGKTYKKTSHTGRQTLDGVQTVSYGRIRYGVGDDFKRTERMREVAELLGKKAKKQNIKTLNKMMDTALPQIRTNLSNKDILIMASNLDKYRVIKSEGFPYNVTTGTLNGVSYVFPVNLYEDVIEFHDKVFRDKDYKPTDKVSTMSDRIINDYSGIGNQLYDPNQYVENTTETPEVTPKAVEEPPKSQKPAQPKKPAKPKTPPAEPPKKPTVPEEPPTPEPPVEPETPDVEEPEEPEQPEEPETPPEAPENKAPKVQEES